MFTLEANQRPLSYIAPEEQKQRKQIFAPYSTIPVMREKATLNIQSCRAVKTVREASTKYHGLEGAWAGAADSGPDLRLGPPGAGEGSRTEGHGVNTSICSLPGEGRAATSFASPVAWTSLTVQRSRRVEQSG